MTVHDYTLIDEKRVRNDRRLEREKEKEIAK